MANSPYFNKERLVIYLAAEGHTQKEIAEETGYPGYKVKEMMEDEKVAFEIRHLRYKLYGKDVKKRFQEMLPHAMDAHEAILTNENTKPALRFQAAQEAYDRALGKPKQTVEHEGSLLRTIFERLDKGDNRPVTIDVIEPGRDVSDVPALEEGTAQIEPSEDVETLTRETSEEEDAIDKWARENL